MFTDTVENYYTLLFTVLGITAFHYQLLLFYCKHTRTNSNTINLHDILMCYAQIGLLKLQAPAC